jgi:hypothetical protein
VAKKKSMRAVVVHGDGRVTVADGKPSSSAAPYDLDGAIKKGAVTFGDPIPLGLHQGTSVLLIIEEREE